MADNFEKDFMRMMREKAAAKALLDPAQFKPDQSITNEQAKAMNLPEAGVEVSGSTKFIADDALRREWNTDDEMQVAASPVGGETPDEAYQTAAKMKADADKQGRELYNAVRDIHHDEISPAIIDLFGSVGINSDYAPDLIQQASNMLVLEKQGAIKLEPEFKKKLQGVLSRVDQIKALDTKADLKMDEADKMRSTMYDLKETFDPEVPKADYLLGFDTPGKLRKK